MPDSTAPPAWVIAIVSQKGGVGKSMLTMALASAMTDSSGRALVVDTDPQATTVDAVEELHDVEYDVAHELDPQVLPQISRMRRHDVLYADTPGSLEGFQVLEQVTKHAHFGLIPHVDEPSSDKPTKRTSDMLTQAGVPHAAVINRVDSRGGASAVLDARKNLEDLQVPYLQSYIRQYSGYPKSLKRGQTIHQWKGHYGAHMRADIGRVQAEVQRRLTRIAQQGGGL